MVAMVARKVSVGKYEIRVDGCKVAYLSDCEVCWIFETDDEELDEYIAAFDRGDMSVSEHLVAFRKAYEALSARDASEAVFERKCEQDALARYEYDPEALIDLDLHNFLAMAN